MCAHLLPVDCSDETMESSLRWSTPKSAIIRSRQLPPRPRSVVKHESVEEKRKREGGTGGGEVARMG